MKQPGPAVHQLQKAPPAAPLPNHLKNIMELVVPSQKMALPAVINSRNMM